MARETYEGDFVGTEVPDLPPIYCIGYVGEIAEPKITESGVYANCRVTLEPTHTGSRKIVTNFLFRPEWFDPGFNPESLKDNKGAYFMFGRTIASKSESSMPQLKGMSGNAVRYKKILALRQSLAASGAFTPEKVFELLKFFKEEPADTGYVLRQATEKTDELDENGKNIYIKRDQYEVRDWFWTDEESIRKVVRKVQMYKGDPKPRLGFEI